MGIKTVMITGDKPLTAAAIAAEAGVDDFLAQAMPEAKLKLIRDYQVGGRLVAMTGDGTNDAPGRIVFDVRGTDMLKQIRPALVVFTLLTRLTGVVYPAVVTLIGQLVFPYRANGSVIEKS